MHQVTRSMTKVSDGKQTVGKWVGEFLIKLELSTNIDLVVEEFNLDVASFESDGEAGSNNGYF